ncbi:MAG: hypothetical protein WCX80_04270, partial [Patescibacteria group bacterium]
MKKSEFIFSLLLVPLDYLMLFLAGVSAYYLRFSDLASGIRPVQFDFNITSYNLVVLIVAAIWIVIFALVG